MSDTDLPPGVQVTMVRKGNQNIVPSNELVLAPGDGLMVISERQAPIAETAGKLGKLEAGRIVEDRSALDYTAVLPHLEITPQRPHWVAGRQDSNLGMAESKSRWFTRLIRARFEKLRKFAPNHIKRLAVASK